MTAALELRKLVGNRHEIVVLDPRPDFTFMMGRWAWYLPRWTHRMLPDVNSDTPEQGGADMPAPTLELWQTEWCPASHRVRQRLTELGLTYTTRQVPVQREARTQLRSLTGDADIPVLVAASEIVRGEQAILAYLNEHFTESPDAAEQRAKAAKAKQKELEAACPKLATAMR
jgi:glutaredoxin